MFRQSETKQDDVASLQNKNRKFKHWPYWGIYQEWKLRIFSANVRLLVCCSRSAFFARKLQYVFSTSSVQFKVLRRRKLNSATDQELKATCWTKSSSFSHIVGSTIRDGWLATKHRKSSWKPVFSKSKESCYWLLLRWSLY